MAKMRQLIGMELPAGILLFTSLVLVGCGLINVAYFESNYRGKVIDAETRRPIEGAVVLGVWRKEYPTIAGAVSDYYDSVELLTDSNGEFYIRGKVPRVITFLQKMDIVIFKAGYESIDQYSWNSLKTKKK